MTIQLKVFLHLHGIWLRLRGLCFDSLGDVREDLLCSEHAIGVETTVAVNLVSTSGLLAREGKGCGPNGADSPVSCGYAW